MKSHHPHLSPLNFQRFVLRAQLGETEHPLAEPKKGEAYRVVMYGCPKCDELYEFRSAAEECCEEPCSGNDLDKWNCPICGVTCESPRDASDCCLWRDYPAQDRWRMADAVEGGSTWAEQLGVDVDRLPNFQGRS